MPVREFVDARGVEWRAWEVLPDALFPPTRGEDFLADCYQLGWIVLETKVGDRRVRVCPIPRDWHHFNELDLEALVAQGEVLPARVPAARAASADVPSVRSFRLPGGGAWTAAVTANPVGPGARVLRFAAGGRVIDLHEWPRDWAELPEDELVALLRRAMAPLSDAQGDGAAGRRDAVG